MALAALATAAMRPTEKMVEERPPFSFEKSIPRAFAGWNVDTSFVPVAPSPEVQAALQRFYTQTLARTYVNAHGQRVMLAVAYGGNQSDALRVHKPEICYAAQGFRILSSKAGTLDWRGANLPVTHVVAEKGLRREPITYWLMVGDHVARSTLERKVLQLRYGFGGVIPDGLLMRVSTIGTDDRQAFEMQQTFIRALLDELPTYERSRLAGIDAREGA